MLGTTSSIGDGAILEADVAYRPPWRNAYAASFTNTRPPRTSGPITIMTVLLLGAAAAYLGMWAVHRPCSVVTLLLSIPAADVAMALASSAPRSPGRWRRTPVGSRLPR